MHHSIVRILEDWVEKINQDEFYFSNAFNPLIQNKTSYEAFDFIPHMLDAIIETSDDFFASQLIFYLNCLYGKADTTEIHPVLLKKQVMIERHLAGLDGHYAIKEYREFKRDLRLT